MKHRMAQLEPLLARQGRRAAEHLLLELGQFYHTQHTHRRWQEELGPKVVQPRQDELLAGRPLSCSQRRRHREEKCTAAESRPTTAVDAGLQLKQPKIALNVGGASRATCGDREGGTAQLKGCRAAKRQQQYSFWQSFRRVFSVQVKELSWASCEP